MRVYSFYWVPGSYPQVYETTTRIYDWTRINILDRLMTSRLRKRFGNWFWPLLLIIFFLLIWQFLWFMWWSSAELPSTDWVDEDVHSKECTNANLLQQYTQAGYKPVHRVTRLKTQQYKPGYCALYNHWQIDRKYLDQEPSQIPILFAVHSTPQYFKYLDEQLKTWDGLISIVLVIPYDLDDSEMDLFRMQIILEGLDRLKAVSDYDRVALHLLFQIQGSDTETCPQLLYNKPDIETMWDKSYAYLMQRDFERLCASQLIYPINVARNIARQAVKTPLFISGDIENIFSWNYEQRMRLFAYRYLIEENHNKTVLVHRRFEVDERELIPRTLSVLKMLFARQRAVVFHNFVFGIGHQIPSLASWLLLGNDNGAPTNVFLTLEYFNEFWEPQYVARNDRTVPLHDESFPFRFRSNTHLGSELCRAGFKFSVVKDLFTVHSGIKRKEREEYMAFLKEEADSGRMEAIASAFMDKLERLYPETVDECPPQFTNFHWSRNYMVSEPSPKEKFTI